MKNILIISATLKNNYELAKDLKNRLEKLNVGTNLISLEDYQLPIYTDSKDIKEDLAFQATANYYDGQTLPQTTGAVDNFNPYLPEEIIKTQQSKSSNNSNPTYEESKLEALELLNNTDIFDNIPDVDE